MVIWLIVLEIVLGCITVSFSIEHVFVTDLMAELLSSTLHIPIQIAVDLFA